MLYKFPHVFAKKKSTLFYDSCIFTKLFMFITQEKNVHPNNFRNDIFREFWHSFIVFFCDFSVFVGFVKKKQVSYNFVISVKVFGSYKAMFWHNRFNSWKLSLIKMRKIKFFFLILNPTQIQPQCGVPVHNQSHLSLE